MTIIRNGVHLLILITLFLIPPLGLASTHHSLPANQQQFIKKLARHSAFNQAKLTKLFYAMHKDPSVIKRMSAPFEKVAWETYRQFFITSKRITDGATYWKKHQRTLAILQKKYGIPAQVLIAITGIETDYGRKLGKLPVANTLYTLAFYYPKRSRFFSSELAQFLLLCKKNKLATLEVKGSYAGALGIPQFMPSSYRHYAVSFSGSSRVDLLKNNDDALTSIANYLKRAGFRQGQPIAMPITQNKKNPIFLSGFQGKLIKAHHFVNHSSYNGKLVGFQGKKKNDYWLVFNNFKAILAYNHSNSYAMVVYQLAQAIKAQHDKPSSHRS